MKKVIFSLFIVILSIIVFPFSRIEAKTIFSLDVTSSNNKMSVEGTTENGVLAVAVLVYSEGNLIHMETCPSISNNYSCELSKIFELGNYTVKVADYDGGDYISKDITIKEEVKINNPQTSDNGISNYIVILIASIVSITILTFIIRKKKTL